MHSRALLMSVSENKADKNACHGSTFKKGIRNRLLCSHAACLIASQSTCTLHTCTYCTGRKHTPWPHKYSYLSFAQKPESTHDSCSHKSVNIVCRGITINQICVPDILQQHKLCSLQTLAHRLRTPQWISFGILQCLWKKKFPQLKTSLSIYKTHVTVALNN